MEDNEEDIGYNCSECSSLIEIISINEDNNTIEFNCINNHNYNIIKIKDYLEKMKKYKENKNTNCEMHKNKKNNEYINYCFDCKYHICAECLKSKIHKNHNKINIFEQPDEEILSIIQNRIEGYNEKINNLNLEKDYKIADLKKRLNNNIIKENEKIKQILNINKTSKEKELKINNKIYIDDIIEIKRKYEEEIKIRKIQYEKENNKINNKYKFINNKEEAINKNKIKEIMYFYNKKINNLSDIYNIKIDNLLNIKQLNEIIYNSYNNKK